MNTDPPRRKYILTDVMILEAATAGLFTLFQTCDIGTQFEPIAAIFTGMAFLLCLGDAVAGAARLGGRSPSLDVSTAWAYPQARLPQVDADPFPHASANGQGSGYHEHRMRAMSFFNYWIAVY